MGVGSGGSAGALVLFFARGFLPTFAVEGKGSTTGEGGWTADVE